MAVRGILVQTGLQERDTLLYPEARLANRTRLSDAPYCTGGFVLGGIVVGLVSRLLIAGHPRAEQGTAWHQRCR